jgi:hypothetical protein
MTEAVVAEDRPVEAAAEPKDDRVTVYQFLMEELESNRAETLRGDEPLDQMIEIPARVVDTIARMIYRIPPAEKTVTRPFDAKHRHLLRVALGNHADNLIKEAKKLEPLGYWDMAARLIADATAITDQIRPEFNEQVELPLVAPKKDEAQTDMSAFEV